MEEKKWCLQCCAAIPEDELAFAKERDQDGYFCEACEYYHYFDADKARPTYRLFLERSSNKEDTRIMPKPTVKLSKRIAPLRYPGGKTKVVDFTYHELVKTGKRTLYSPFIGGGSIEFALLDAGVVDKLVLNDLDQHLVNFYDVVFHQTEELVHAIETQPLTVARYEEAHAVVNAAFENHAHLSSVQKAFYYLLNNRCSFSGIYKAGRMGGKNGAVADLSARWNPKNIITRIQRLGELSSRVVITNLTYAVFIDRYAWDDDGVFVIDPPYVEKAEDIYRHAFSRDEHRKLFQCLTDFWNSHPNSDFFVFYDEHPYLYELAIPDDVQILARKYSIAN